MVLKTTKKVAKNTGKPWKNFEKTTKKHQMPENQQKPFFCKGVQLIPEQSNIISVCKYVPHSTQCET